MLVSVYRVCVYVCVLFYFASPVIAATNRNAEVREGTELEVKHVRRLVRSLPLYCSVATTPPPRKELCSYLPEHIVPPQTKRKRPPVRNSVIVALRKLYHILCQNCGQ